MAAPSNGRIRRVFSARHTSASGEGVIRIAPFFMAHEYIDDIDSFQAGQGTPQRVEFESACKIALLRVICGPEPKGTKLELLWEDKEYDGLEVKVIHFPIIALTWEEGSLGPEEDEYLQKCKSAFHSLDDLLSYEDLWRLHDEIKNSIG